MSHFAEIKDGIVCQVIVVNNSEILDENGQERESLGIAFCKSLYGADTEWVQTSYNNNFRGKFAGLNETWDGNNFVSPTAE